MEENMQVSSGEQSGIFDSYETYVDATRWSRFFNFVIDWLFMSYVLSYATGFILGAILGIIAPEFIAGLAYQSEYSGDMILLNLALGYFNFLIYYTFCEKVFNGFTLGKLITGTKAIRIDGGSLTFRDAILRSLTRVVPFEILSSLRVFLI